MSVTPHELNRLEALRRYQILDTVPDEAFDRLTQLASLICQTPISLVSLVDEHQLWCKSTLGIELDQISRDIAFCQHTILDSTLFEVEDTTQDSRFKLNPLVTSAPHVRFYAGYPLTDPDGYALGTLCVLDHTPRKLTQSQQKALQLLGEIATSLIVDHRQKQELTYFENLFTLSNDLIFVAGVDGYLKKLNPAFSQLLGWDEDYLLTTPFLHLVHPDDRLGAEEAINQLATGNLATQFSYRFRTKEGHYRCLQWVATPESATGYLFAIARDVTVQKQRERQLYQSENKFRSFFENSQGLMCIHDLEGKLLTVNTAGAQALGYQPDELIGQPLKSIIPPSQHTAFDGYLQVIQQKGKANGLLHTYHKDGSLQIWLFANVLERELNGDAYVIGNAIDITRRHQLEVDLTWTKKMLEQTNEVARIGTWEVDVNQQTVYWSAVTKAIHEVPAEFDPTFDEAISFFKGENQQRILQAVDQALHQGESYDLELPITTAKGNEIWIRVVGTAEFDSGICQRLYGIFQDIDDKKRAGQALLNEKLRLTAFVEHAPAAVAMVDRSATYLAVSNRWMEDYGLSGSVIGLSHYEVFPNQSENWRAIFERCSNGAVEKREEQTWRPQGWHQDQYLSWEVRPWYQFDGSMGGIMMFTQDITQACQQRDELQKAKQLAEQASRVKSEFLANMSHEIRTPLNGVIGFTDLLLKTSLNETQHQYLSIVDQSANALLSIINDILDFSKIEAGKLELAIDRVDVYDIASQAADIITYQAQNKGLEMLLNLSADLPRFIYIDSVRLKQILVNLLGNAVKFTQQGEIELAIKPLTDPTQDYVSFRFEVRDTGIGIKAQMQDRIFDAFAQEDASTTKKYGGTGLGLTISNKLLGLMGSRLELVSKPEEGSCFFFDVRLKTEIGDPINWQAMSLIKKVLLVDDNENNRLILRQMFLLKQISVDEASNGFEALQLLGQQKQYDVILMDYHMPYMDGIETIEKIRANFPAAMEKPVIILLHSSSDDERLIKASERLAIHQRIVKPVKMTELFQALSRLGRQEEISAPIPIRQPRPIDTARVKILLVEDNPVNQLLAKTIVSRLVPNAQIGEAINGQEALAMYQQDKPDLILMDIQMPVMNGYEAAHRIREMETGSHTPIIALTAGTVKGEREKCLAAGMDDFITKPIVEASLVPLFQKWLASLPIPPRDEQTLALGDHVNFDVLKTMAGQDVDLVNQLMEVAASELKSSLSGLLQQAEAMNTDGLKATGHKLRGTALSAGMPSLAQLAATLEQLEMTEAESLGDLVNAIQSEIVIILSFLSEALKTNLRA
ncbi:hybrid sensor histidine kinase/response regulator [Spirosoma pollinicola]|uniref:histidine kinase n=2 Tax=Spirosoma pollinicola TaxID=2057025 RepID=A0A2K8ZCK9_9BACT|nr:hybrid sensor histidine kinase/response regulator [Spirosoma pollinicola]